MNDTQNMTCQLGATIRRLRTERGITQDVLARELNVSFQAVSKWETNATLPDVTLLPQIALYFGVSMDTLFAMDTDKQVEHIRTMLRDEEVISNEKFVWAERYLTGLLTERPQDSDVRMLLIELYAHRENRDSLAQGRLIEEGCAYDAENSVLLGMLVSVREKRREPDRLINFLEALLQKHTGSAAIEDRLINACIKNRRFERVSELMQRASERPMLGLYRGDLILAQEGNEEAAKKQWQRTADAFCKDALLLLKTAERFEKIGDAETAIALYERSYELTTAPKWMDSLYARAFLYERIGDIPKAIKMWEKIIVSYEEDYGINSGNAVNWPRNELARLRKIKS